MGRVIEVSGLSNRYGDKLAVDALSFGTLVSIMRPGTVIALR
ncbi:hypothetical protein [Micromonospora deserti]|nr:hypothetical protein [Micromonospora deserti]